jgi:hypothetical protein
VRAGAFAPVRALGQDTTEDNAADAARQLRHGSFDRAGERRAGPEVAAVHRVEDQPIRGRDVP